MRQIIGGIVLPITDKLVSILDVLLTGKIAALGAQPILAVAH